MSHYEVVKINGEYCLRIKSNKHPVAWSKTEDAAWKSYVQDREEDARNFDPDE